LLIDLCKDAAMSLDESTLLAYVDGQLPAAQQAEVERAVAADPALAQTLQALRASQLPFAQAFEQQPVPALPPALRQHVDQLVAGHAQAQARAQAQAWVLAEAGVPPAPRGRERQLLALMFALVLAAMLGWWAGHSTRSHTGHSVEPWVRMVSSYHLMYGRETVQDGGVGLAQVSALKARLRDQHQLELKIPDLQSQGLQFVRAQQLQLDGKMVLQLVYLPADGLPVALCLTPATAQAERTVSLDGQALHTWFDGGWAYLLVGRLPAPALQQLRGAIKAPVV
jgi:anti-sigma factor RsiW